VPKSSTDPSPTPKSPTFSSSTAAPSSSPPAISPSNTSSALFPYYLLVLRKATPFALIIFFLARASNLLYVRTLHDLIAGIAQSLAQLIPDLLIFVAWVTIAFAIAEYVYNHNHAKPFGLSWDPTKLPAVKPQFKGKSRTGRIVDLVFHCLWMLYVLAIPTHPYLILGPGLLVLRTFSVTFAPAWHTFYLLLLVVLAVQLITKTLALNATYDDWKSALDLVTKFTGVATAAYLASMKTYLVATSPSANQQALTSVNHSIGIGFRIVLVIVFLQLLIGAWKLLRPRLRTRSLVF
jgi:hypothetical protein